jgi:hypothetical protein
MDDLESIMKLVPTDSSGKWVSTQDVRVLVDSMLNSNWDHYSGLPSVSAYIQEPALDKQ